MSEESLEKRYRIGELASITGVTVRTLHHYDEIGLLSPAERTDAGHRLYGHGDVARLYGIIALRQIGLSLDEVSAVMRDDLNVRAVVERQLERLALQLQFHERLQTRLTHIRDELDRAHEPSTRDFIEALEVMNRMESYYTPEQLEQLEERRNELGDEGMRRAEQEWSDLIAAVEAEHAAGTDPADPKVQALARKWKELIEAFTGGDPGIRASLQRMYETEGPEKASRGAVNPEVMAYAQRAMEVGQG